MKKKVLIIIGILIIGLIYPSSELDIFNEATHNVKKQNDPKSNNNLTSSTKERKVFNVHNLSELLNALGDNRTINIKDSISITKEFSSAIPLDEFHKYYNEYEEHKLIYKSDFFSFSSNYSINPDISKPETFYLTIENTTNLILIGNNNFTEITIENRDSAVLDFQGNENLELRNLRLFHDLETETDCGDDAPVLNFNNDKNVTIVNCDLNGSGTIGIRASFVNSIIVEDSKIHNCTYSALNIHNVDYFYFKNSVITKNHIAYSLVETKNSNLTFEASQIKSNYTNSYADFIYKENSEVLFTNCVIKNDAGFNPIPEHNSVFDESNEVDLLIEENVNIPDPNFLAYLINLEDLNTNGDERIQVAEAKVYNGIIDVDGSEKPEYEKIKDLTGIEAFVSLTELNCNDNKLKELDVSKNVALTVLECHYNQLNSLNLKTNTNLTEIGCIENQLTNLDVSKNTELTRLHCSYNKLTHLDVSKNAKLSVLYCGANQLTNLNVSNNTELTSLSCSSNKLKSLDVSKNTRLFRLGFSNNQINSIDVSNITGLNILGCESNPLNSLNLLNNTSLSELYCNDNQLTRLNLSKNTELRRLQCYNNQLTRLNVSKSIKLFELLCYNNKFKKLDVSNNNDLKTLQCNNNQLISLDLPINSELTRLLCYNNLLTRLDVSKNTRLNRLECYNNQLTVLDVSKNKMLEILWCDNNKLTSLNIQNGNNTSVKAMRVNNNPNLTCILVDDETASHDDPCSEFYLYTWCKDDTANYSENCK